MMEFALSTADRKLLLSYAGKTLVWDAKARKLRDRAGDEVVLSVAPRHRAHARSLLLPVNVRVM